MKKQKPKRKAKKTPANSAGSALADQRWDKPGAKKRDSERMKAVWAERNARLAAFDSIVELLELLAEPCQLDLSDNCATHKWPFGDEKCPHTRARRWLKEWRESK